MKRLVSVLVFTMFFGLIFAQNSTDSILFQKFLNFAQREKLAEKPAGERVAAIGKYFMNTPYVASTLEAPGPERLQVNLHGLDCTTLVENALALSKMLSGSPCDFDAFKRWLTSIRYRDGKLDGYPSRLHYASDWLTNNVQKGLISYVRMGLSKDTLYPKVYYMSTHPSAYLALRSDTTFIAVIAEQEKAIDRLTFAYMPKEKVTQKAPYIKSGDIVAISTSFPGLDFSHLGIAIRQKGKVYLLHASTTGKKVLISEMPLSDYLAGIKKHGGIVIARPL
ncbi:MAG TPA: N-acetylmuramoyl-L-alanine amidase-like domain-containing protein [Bacteroidales bacterium]|nr:N-acetylmuramoyl-L-alanine amidase-like domain-containing protein [Bacteroidales bacterium]